jgi:hypothetical protein
MARPVSNITITVPQELKQLMDEFSWEHPGTNWSLIARQAIQQYIETKRVIVPHVGITLDSVDLTFTPQMGSVLKTLLVFQNRMPTEIVVDRVGITQTLLTGIDKFLVSRDAWHMSPTLIPRSGQSVVADFFPMAPTDLFAIEGLVTSSLTLKAHIETYVQGFREPVRTEVISKIPLEEWKEFMVRLRRAYPHIAIAFEQRYGGHGRVPQELDRSD